MCAVRTWGEGAVGHHVLFGKHDTNFWDHSTEHIAADRGKRLLQLARFDPAAGDILALNAAEVRKCTHRASRPDGSCAYWSVVNGLPSFGSKSARSEDGRIARIKGVVSEEIADLVFGSDHENKLEDTPSQVEGHLLVTHCYDLPTPVRCASCHDKRATREAVEVPEFFFCALHTAKASEAFVGTIDLQEGSSAGTTFLCRPRAGGVTEYMAHISSYWRGRHVVGKVCRARVGLLAVAGDGGVGHRHDHHRVGTSAARRAATLREQTNRGCVCGYGRWA